MVHHSHFGFSERDKRDYFQNFREKMSLEAAHKIALDKHNELRALHHDIPPMTMSDELNQEVN